MESFLFSILHSYRTKIVAIVCAIASFALLIVHYLITPITLAQDISFSETANYFHFALLFSLDIIMGSREKIEDERISIIRSRSFMLASQIFMSTLLTGLMISIFSKPITDFVSGVITYAYIYLVAYLVIFQAAIYFDTSTVDNDIDLEASINKRPKFYQYYTILIIALIIAVFLFVYI